MSRNSIREALKALQALDIVEIRHGYDTYVGRLSLDPLADGVTFRADNALVTQLLRAFWDVFHRVNHRLGVTDPNPMQTVRRHRAIVTALRERTWRVRSR